MEGQSGLSEFSVISWVSVVEGCPLSEVPLYIMKEMCKLVDTDYPFLSVCVLLLTVLSFIFIYFTFFALPLINFDILNEQSNRIPRCSRKVSAAALPWLEHIGKIFVSRL